jgi:hypothetical protein
MVEPIGLEHYEKKEGVVDRSRPIYLSIYFQSVSQSSRLITIQDTGLLVVVTKTLQDQGLSIF